MGFVQGIITMTAAALWQRYKDWLYYHDGLGSYLDISRVGMEDAFVANIQPRLQKAFADMAALEPGAISTLVRGVGTKATGQADRQLAKSAMHG
jgi:hypothetical protein